MVFMTEHGVVAQYAVLEGVEADGFVGWGLISAVGITGVVLVVWVLEFIVGFQ